MGRDRNFVHEAVRNESENNCLHDDFMTYLFIISSLNH